jgi:hypothetical protein
MRANPHCGRMYKEKVRATNQKELVAADSSLECLRAGCLGKSYQSNWGIRTYLQEIIVAITPAEIPVDTI